MSDASRSDTLLGPNDPPAFEILHPERAAPLLIVCDHASRAVPRALGQLGLADADLMRHIGWDIGAAGVTRLLCDKLLGARPSLPAIRASSSTATARSATRPRSRR